MPSSARYQRRAYRLERGHDAGKRLHLIDHGPREARPVLLLHGNPTWSFLWRKVIARLPDLRRVAPDLLGFGLSDKLGRLRDHSVERHLDALEELTLALDLKGVILVGQDWGGPLAAASAPGWRRSARAGASPASCWRTRRSSPARPKGTWFHRFARTPVVAQVAFRVLGFPLRTLHKTQGDPRSIEGVVAQAYQWPLSRILDRAGPLALARMVPDSLEHPLCPGAAPGARAWARGFQGPMALVWGRARPGPRAGARQARRGLPPGGGDPDPGRPLLPGGGPRRARLGDRRRGQPRGATPCVGPASAGAGGEGGHRARDHAEDQREAHGHDQDQGGDLEGEGHLGEGLEVGRPGAARR